MHLKLYFYLDALSEAFKTDVIKNAKKNFWWYDPGVFFLRFIEYIRPYLKKIFLSLKKHEKERIILIGDDMKICDFQIQDYIAVSNK